VGSPNSRKTWTAEELGQSVQSQRRQIKKIVAGLTSKEVRKEEGFSWSGKALLIEF